MKVKKQCPECSGKEIYTKEVAFQGHGKSAVSYVGGIWKASKADIYICGRCGCYQTFIAQEHLEEIKENWKQHV